MTEIISSILSYLIGLAVNFRTNEILKHREAILNQQLESEERIKASIKSLRPLRDEVRVACTTLARDRLRFGISAAEEPLWLELSDDSFQALLLEWLQAGSIEEGADVKNRLIQRFESALNTGITEEQKCFLENSFFESIEKTIFAHPLLAHWRHQLSLEYLREQVGVLRSRAEEAAGVYSIEKQTAALLHYCDTALAAWDIIDLSNLPEGDIHMATQKLLLRQLYMPLRIQVEHETSEEGEDATLLRIEKQREIRRQVEAGYIEEPFDTAMTSRSPVGSRLDASRRLVILGDPGGGKTTLLRWMATAYLLRQKRDTAFKEIPDTETLPEHDWIPVLIRCRDLGESDLSRCFLDFLTQHLNKTELLPVEADIMRAVILDRIAKGEVLLLVDGLDEITSPRVRMLFCQELERTATRYPDTPIIVTSRIVGYREMPYRMGSGFQHAVIAELSREDKDLFARRWVDVTEQHQSISEKAKRAQELLEALHSNDRIERLTGNPMLLTTLALVKRKVGKLPNRRNKLYAEAVAVLLNWNPRLYETIDEAEAIPQLEYLAYEMCRRGVQRLSNDEVLDLLDKVRDEYKNIRAIRNRAPEEFIQLLEARSSIIIKSGGLWDKKGQDKGVWEFRHLTFQEYLAARALIDGRYPGRDKTKSLAQQVAPLAGDVKEVTSGYSVEEVEVQESWREALRLVVADCKDDDVDEVLLAILRSADGEDNSKTGRPRALLAALCLADEPNVSEEVAREVLRLFVSKVGKRDGTGSKITPLDRAAIELSGTIWAEHLKEALFDEFMGRQAVGRARVGGLIGMTELRRKGGSAKEQLFPDVVAQIESLKPAEAIPAALTMMEAAFEGIDEIPANLLDALIGLLESGDDPAKLAAAWALGWLCRGAPHRTSSNVLELGNNDIQRIIAVLSSISDVEVDTARWLSITLGCTKTTLAVPALLARLDQKDSQLRIAVIESLSAIGDKSAVPRLIQEMNDKETSISAAAIEALVHIGDRDSVPPMVAKLREPQCGNKAVIVDALKRMGDPRAIVDLIVLLDDPDDDLSVAASVALIALGEERGSSTLASFLDHHSAKKRKAAVKELVSLRNDPVEMSLLSQDLDRISPWIDPKVPIAEPRITEAAKALGKTSDEVRCLYESMTEVYHLILGGGGDEEGCS